MEKLQRPVIKAMLKAKQNMEALITKTLKIDEALCSKVKRMQSVRGIGPVTATALLVYTKGFTAFDNAKQLACYCGVVPFNKTSSKQCALQTFGKPLC